MNNTYCNTNKITYLKLSLIFFILFFASCSKNTNGIVMLSSKSVSFFNMISILSDGVCSKINVDKPLYISDFVNIKTLKNNSQLGFILSSELKVSLFKNCNSDIVIKEIEFRDSVKLNKKGINLLSRAPKDIKAKYILKNHQVLVGTYSITNKQLILYLKLIDFDSGNALDSSRTAILLNEEILALEGKIKKKKFFESEVRKNMVL